MTPLRPEKAPTRKKVRKTRFLRVKNWSRFQHYKKRNPPWIRLHRSILRDRQFLMLTEIEQWQLVRLWLIASENDNKLADDEVWLRRAIGTRKTLPVSTFKRLGFLETWRSPDETPASDGLPASTALAPGMQAAEPDSSDVSENSETREHLQRATKWVDTVGWQYEPIDLQAELAKLRLSDVDRAGLMELAATKVQAVAARNGERTT